MKKLIILLAFLASCSDGKDGKDGFVIEDPIIPEIVVDPGPPTRCELMLVEENGEMVYRQGLILPNGKIVILPENSQACKDR